MTASEHRRRALQLFALNITLTFAMVVGVFMWLLSTGVELPFGLNGVAPGIAMGTLVAAVLVRIVCGPRFEWHMQQYRNLRS